MKRIYVVSTFYHALISCAKQLAGRGSADILVTDHIPEGRLLAQKLEASGIFERTLFVENIREYSDRNRLDYLLFHHRKNAETIEGQLDFSLRDYEEINLFHDDIWVSRYLKDRRISYNLIEDALDSFQIIRKTPFAYMFEPNRLKRLIKRSFRIGYVYCGADSCTKSVEVNSAEGLDFLGISDKLVVSPRKELFGALDGDAVRKIRDIFLGGEKMPAVPEKSVLLLTQALIEYGVVSDEEAQLEAYRRLAAKTVGQGDVLVIKPHPRDNADYRAAFPNAVILDRNMPIEALLLGEEKRFKAAVMFSVSTISGLDCAEQMIVTDFDDSFV